MRGQHKHPFIGWNPPTERSQWARGEAKRRGIPLSQILNEALEHERERVMAETAAAERDGEMPDAGESALRIHIPPRLRAKLEEIIGSTPLETWVKDVIVHKMENALPELRRSALWRGDVADWFNQGETSGD